MDEFEIIRLFFQKQQADSSIPIGIGDDGAVIQPSSDKNLIVTTDTSISGIHFPVMKIQGHLLLAYLNET